MESIEIHTIYFFGVVYLKLVGNCKFVYPACFVSADFKIIRNRSDRLNHINKLNDEEHSPYNSKRDQTTQ